MEAESKTDAESRRRDLNEELRGAMEEMTHGQKGRRMETWRFWKDLHRRY